MPSGNRVYQLIVTHHALGLEWQNTFYYYTGSDTVHSVFDESFELNHVFYNDVYLTEWPALNSIESQLRFISSYQIWPTEVGGQTIPFAGDFGDVDEPVQPLGSCLLISLKSFAGGKRYSRRCYLSGQPEGFTTGNSFTATAIAAANALGEKIVSTNLFLSTTGPVLFFPVAYSKMDAAVPVTLPISTLVNHTVYPFTTSQRGRNVRNTF